MPYTHHILLDATIPPEAGVAILIILEVMCCALFVAPFFFWAYLPLLSLQKELLDMVGKKHQTIAPKTVWLQMIPVFNFFIAYIVVHHLKVSMLAWSHENELDLGDKYKRSGRLACHSGVLFFASFFFAPRLIECYILLGLPLLVLWLVFIRKYFWVMMDISRKMKMVINSENATQE
jgi:hypothetical protein